MERELCAKLGKRRILVSESDRKGQFIIHRPQGGGTGGGGRKICTCIKRCMKSNLQIALYHDMKNVAIILWKHSVFCK